MKSRIFITTVSRELAKTRQLGANILTRLGYEPVWQDIFSTESGDVRQMLREKIDACSGLVHVVGRGYGAEPPSPDAEFGRVSYTQYDLMYAQKTGKKTWIVFVEDGFPIDLPMEQLDLPAAGHSDPAAYQAERRALQDAWREKLRGESHLWHAAASTLEFELRVERLKDELRSLGRNFRFWQRTVLAALMVLVLLGGGLYALLFRQRDEMQQVAKQVEHVQNTVDEKTQRIESQLAALKPEDIKTQLQKTIEQTYQRELEEAEKLSDRKKRAEAKKDAAELREKRLGQVNDFLNSIINTIKTGDATPEFLEFTRIFKEQGAAEALNYIAEEESRLLTDAEKLTQQKRRKLAPVLEAVRVQMARGEVEEAKARCEKLLKQEPNWPELLYCHWWTLVEIGDRAIKYDTIEKVFEAFEASRKSAQRRLDDDPKDAQKQRDLSISYESIGDVYVTLGRTDEALKQHEDSLKICLTLASDDPKDAQKQHDLMVSHYKLGVTHKAKKDYDQAITELKTGVKVLDNLIAAKLRVESAANEKAFLEKQIQECRELLKKQSK
jgi:tetratricopeptide (TPR) repeat protein